MRKTIVSLETERLLLRPMTSADLAALEAIMTDPKVQLWLNEARPAGRAFVEKTINAYAEHMAEKGFTRYGVVLKSSGDLIGRCGVMVYEDFNDIGWLLARGAWGQGLATEAARGVLNALFGGGMIADVTAKAFRPNHGSIGVMKKLGMRFDRSERFKDPEYPWFSTHFMDYYVLSANEYLGG